MNSARNARNALSAVFLLGLLVFTGCSTSTAPTYSKNDLEKTIVSVLKQEYKTDAACRLAGRTLWIYVPVDKLFEKTSGKDPKDKVKERFEIQENESGLTDGLLSVGYLVKPVIPEREKDQGYKLNKQAMEKINDAWEVTRRVVFSMNRAERDDVQFYVLLAADTNVGLELRETIYYKDLIKVLYRGISPGEYHHRVPVKSGLAPEAIGDKPGRNVKYEDISFSEFLCRQIEHRITLKFQKPEVEQDADTDKEIQKIVLDTLRIYRFEDFRVGELTNLLTNARIHVDPADIKDFKPVR